MKDGFGKKFDDQEGIVDVVDRAGFSLQALVDVEGSRPVLNSHEQGLWEVCGSSLLFASRLIVTSTSWSLVWSVHIAGLGAWN